MGADQQFCLRWNNFHTNITSAFESLRDDEDFVDITLACEGKQIKAHKMVLSACSPYFRSLLKGNPCQHPIVFLKDVTFANLTSILDFMYHGEVNVSHNELATFLKTAESLKVRGLAEDEKKKEAEGYNEASSPPPPRDPPDPGSPRGPGEEANSAPDTHTSDSPPPPKRQRRRSGASIHSAEDTNETVLSEPRDNSVKNEPQDYNEDDADILIHSDNTQDIKQDIEDNSEERNFGLSESVTISRSQAAMQQLQESFGSFLPGMGQSPGFLPHGATDMPRPPPYSLEGVQGLPPGISALPGPSMSQGAASQDASQDGSRHKPYVCQHCFKSYSSKSNLNTHVRDLHAAVPSIFTCPYCNKTYSSKNSLRYHITMYHRGEKHRDQALQHALATAQPIEHGAVQPGVERPRIQNPQSHSSVRNQIVSPQARGQHHHLSDQPYTRLHPPSQNSRQELNVTNQSFPQRNETNRFNQRNQLEMQPTEGSSLIAEQISTGSLSFESVDQSEQEIQLVHSQMSVQGTHQPDFDYENFVDQKLENDFMNHIENASGGL